MTLLFPADVLFPVDRFRIYTIGTQVLRNLLFSCPFWFELHTRMQESFQLGLFDGTISEYKEGSKDVT